MAVTLTLNTTEWDRGVARLAQRYPNAVTRAMNRAATSARVVMVREVARDLGLRQADISDNITIRPTFVSGASGNVSTKFTAQVIGSGARIPLYRFRARQTRAGVTARLPTGAGTYPGAFIATMKSGHVGVFKRKGATRLPIQELFGPSVTRVFEKYIPIGAARGHEQLGKNLVSEFRFALSQSAA